MRSYLLLLFSTLFCHDSAGQSYSPLIEESKTWDIIKHEFYDPCDISGAFHYYFDGDTIIDGIDYQIAWSYPVGIPNDFPCSMFEIDESDSVKKAYLREDTTLRQVYVYDEMTDSDKLLYDFSLLTGDTLLADYHGYWQDLIVDSVGWVILANSEQRKIWYFNSGENYVEGIGSSEGPFASLNPGIGVWLYVNCVTKDDVFLWNESQNFSSPACFGYLNTSDYVFSSLSVYPTLTSGLLKIDYHNPNFADGFTAQVFDVQGHLIKEYKLYNSSNTNVCDVSTLASGIYLLKVIENGVEKSAAKFVKQ